MPFSAGALCILILAIVHQLTSAAPPAPGSIAFAYSRVANYNSCVKGLRASLIFELCYNATYDLIRRGVSQDTAAVHVSSVVREFIKYAKEEGKNTAIDTVGDLCIPVEKYSPLFTVRWTTVFTEEELDDMLMTIGNSFYSVANIDVPLPELTPALEQDRLKVWTKFLEQLQQPMNQINYTSITFPMTARHSFDWRKDSACAEWHRFSQHPTSTSAVTGLRRVLKMAVELVNMGSDPNAAWQLVRHYTALVHLGIRCLKTEGSELQVPNAFQRTYGRAAIKLLKQAQDDRKFVQGQRVPDPAFDAVFDFEYQQLSRFGSWGQPDAHFGPGVTIKNMLAFTSHAAQTQLQFASMFYQNNSNPLYTTRLPANQPDCTSANNWLGNMQCETTDEFCFFGATWQVSSWYENCCNKLICDNVVSILPEYFDDYAGCCEACHQLDCSPTFTENEDINVPRSSGDTNVTVHVYV